MGHVALAWQQYLQTPGEMDVLLDSPAVCVAAYGRVLATVLYGMPGVDDLKQLAEVQLDYQRRAQGKLVNVTLVTKPAIGSLDREFFLAAREYFGILQSAAFISAVVVEKGGLRQLLLRGLLKGLQFLVSTIAISAFTDRKNAYPWLTQSMQDMGIEAPSPHKLDKLLRRAESALSLHIV